MPIRKLYTGLEGTSAKYRVLYYCLLKFKFLLTSWYFTVSHCTVVTSCGLNTLNGYKSNNTSYGGVLDQCLMSLLVLCTALAVMVFKTVLMLSVYAFNRNKKQSNSVQCYFSLRLTTLEGGYIFRWRDRISGDETVTYCLPDMDNSTVYMYVYMYEFCEFCK